MIGAAPAGRATVISHQLHTGHSLSWVKKLVARTSLFLFAFIILNIVSYFVFQKITLPFTTMYGRNVSFTSYIALEQDINKRLATETITITYKDKSKDFKYADLGLMFDSQKTFSFIDDRTVWNIPLVQLMLNGSAQLSPAYEVDQNRLERSLAELVEEIDTKPKDASLVFPFKVDSDFTITKSVTGQKMNTKIAAEQFLTKIKTLDYTATNLELKPQNVSPAVKEADLEGKITFAKELLQDPVIVLDENKKEVTKIYPENFIHFMGNKGKEIAPTAELLGRYIHEELALYFYVAPTPKRVDGGVVTAAGANGQGLDEEQAAQALSQALIDPSVRKVSLTRKTIKAPVVTDGVYPKTDEGLAALLQDFDNTKYGEYNLIVREMKDGGLGASNDATQIIIPASTYKAFIAFAALKSIERGEFTLDSMTPHGTVRDCMYEMIHVSTDHCAISIQDFMGWQKVDDIIHQAGFVDTNINNEGFGGEKYTTALDEYRLFRGLYDGSLLNKEHTNHLLDLFKNQMWRSGIPAGSAPAVVADKVGFYALRENDVGIVYAGKGDYIIVAMSNRGTFGEISQLARQVYQFFGN